jgi:hypothetical protein
MDGRIKRKPGEAIFSSHHEIKLFFIGRGEINN